MIIDFYKGNGGSGSQGPEGPQGPQGATGPQGPAGGNPQIPTECPDVQLLLDICDGNANVAVHLKDAAGNLLGNFSTSSSPYSIYFEGEYAGGMYQIEFEGEWNDDSIHFIYDCDGIYAGGLYNINKAFDKISIDITYDEGTGEYTPETHIHYVGDGYKIELSSMYPDDFTQDDIDALNDFIALFDGDNSVFYDSYVAINDSVYYPSWFSIGNDGGEFSYVNSVAANANQIMITYENGEYTNASYTEWFSETLIPSSIFPADPVEGQIANYDDGQGNIGLYRYDGTDWQPYGGGGSGVLVVNSLSSTEAANAPVGSLIGQYKEEGTMLTTMPTNTGDANAKSIVVIGDVDFSSARVYVSFSSSNIYMELGRSGGKWTKLDKGQLSGRWTLDGVDIGTSWTGETDGNVLQLSDGVNWSVTFTKQENGDWIGTITGGTDPHYKYISNLTGSNAFRYEANAPMEVNLYMKVSGGTVAHWQGYRDANQTDSFEAIYDDLYDFTTFCDNKLMFSVRYSSSNYFAYMDAANQAIVYYSDSAKTTEVTRIAYLGDPVKLTTANSTKYLYAEWKEDGVYFYDKQLNVYFENLIDFHTEGVHFSRITDPTKATASDLGLGNATTNGVPIWNNEGIIVGKKAEWQTRDSYVNTTGSSTTVRTSFVYSGYNHFPERIWVPTTGGVQGQMLISGGDNAAPTWTNWIKVVKITSDAYEALVTKDPNTLYVIDDNV